MKLAAIIVVQVACLAGLVAGPARFAAAGDRGGANVQLLGSVKLTGVEWGAADEQDELGVELAVRRAGWPLALDLSWLSARGKGRADEHIGSARYGQLEREAVTEEAGFGLRKTWSDGRGFSVYAGGGGLWARGSISYASVASFSDEAFGWYGNAGFYITFAGRATVGMQGRYSEAPVSLNGREMNAGGWHYGATAGLQF